MDNILIQALQNNALYSHDVTEFKVIETHLSWVILTGLFAYKIKKPLNLGFQDFTTLEKRRYYCELELDLNQKLAKEIYLEVLPITGSSSKPQLGGLDHPIEYTIKMREFSQEKMLNVLAKQRQLTKPLIDDLANQLANFHGSASICDSMSTHGLPAQVFSPIQENFQVLKQLSSSSQYIEQISHIEQWANEQFSHLQPLMSLRKKQGFIRACHGDLHLGNMVLFNHKPLIFDCIEFNESFRWIDVMNDIGFLTMDLLHVNAPELKNLFINKYLEKSYDYSGIPLLRFYESYRAMVRAKVLSFQLEQSPSKEVKNSLEFQIETFLKVAQSLIPSPKPSIMLTYGVSGSGKTRYTEQLMMETGAIRLRSDICRKHLQEGLYSQEATQMVYAELASLAKMLLKASYSIIIDATCLKTWQRALFLELSEYLDVPMNILSFEAPVEILQERIRERLKKGLDVSQANEEVLAMQLQSIDPLSEKEKALTTFIRFDKREV